MRKYTLSESFAVICSRFIDLPSQLTLNFSETLTTLQTSHKHVTICKRGTYSQLEQSFSAQ